MLAKPKGKGLSPPVLNASVEDQTFDVHRPKQSAKYTHTASGTAWIRERFEPTQRNHTMAARPGLNMVKQMN